MAIKPVEILIKAKDEASGIFGLLRRNAVELGVTIAGYFGVKSFVGAVQGAADLEAKLSEVRAVSGATAAEMQLLRKAAEDAGATTKFSAEEGADALGNLARAGLSAQQAITALPPTLQLAQAGGLGLAESAEIVTRTLAGFNLEASQAGRIADVLAQGANASNTSVTGLGQALSYAAPTAVSLGLSLETTVAIIGKFADAGIDASRAGTALNAILSQFSDPASKFRNELAAMGITTTDFEQALRQLAAAGPAGQKAVLAVGTEAGPALRALLNQGIGALDELKTKLDDAAGSAATTAAQMEDNLNGALSGLASAWDTVKNALATPVLPVLKQGAQDLANTLREAVSSGAVGRFGDAIAKGFQAALEWGKRFAAEVDVEALVARLSSAASSTGQAFDTIAEYARNAGATVQTVWGVMTAGTNAVLSVVYALGSAFAGVASGIQSGVALILEGLAKVTFGDVSRDFEQAAAKIRVSAGATWASAEALAAKSTESFEGMAEGASQARDGWATLTDTTQAAADAATVSETVFKQVGETLKEVGGDATAMGQKAQAAAVLQTEAARKTRAEVEALKLEYEAALQAGDVQTALGKLQQMQDALGKTAGAAKATGEEVAAAFERMGVKSKTELTKMAENAKRDFDLIKNSGDTTADGLAQAFRRYAEAAIAANGGVATASLQTEASMRGLEITTDATGKTIVRSMKEAGDATDGAGDSANRAAGGYRNMAQSAEQAAASAKRLAEINARYARPGQNSTKKGSENDYDPGRDMYSRPGEDPRNGNGQTQAEYQRKERLGGQNAVDNTLAFKLRDKLDAGTLTADDAADIRAVIASLDQNEQVNRDLDRMNPGAFSLTGAADRNEWKAVRARLEQSLGNGQVGRTVQVSINTGRGQETVNTDEAGAQALVRSLQVASLASRG